MERRPLLLAMTGLLACGARTPLDAPPTISDGGALTDASAPTDASPTNDGPVSPDAPSSHCPDGGPIELVYALDDVGGLYRYDPLTAKATLVGTPNCGNGNVQWTMTASPEYAYIVYTDWTLFEVNLATMECSQTLLQPGQLGIEGEFGVAIVGTGASERLYVYGLTPQSTTPILAVADTTSFTLTKVADILPAPPPSSFPVNLTSDMAGNLYAYSPGGLVQKIDSATGTVLQSVDTGVTASTWATITYGTDLYLWADTHVEGYDLATRTRTSDHDVGIASVGAASFPACP